MTGTKTTLTARGERPGDEPDPHGPSAAAKAAKATIDMARRVAEAPVAEHERRQHGPIKG